MAQKPPTQKKDQDQDIEPLKEQLKSLTRELLQERITRIDFQVQILMQWRHNCQQELNLFLAGRENCKSPEDSHG
jgi:hypothetical protein